jgi:cobalt-zinc-cadmium efflux system outer membrane protein
MRRGWLVLAIVAVGCQSAGHPAPRDLPAATIQPDFSPPQDDTLSSPIRPAAGGNGARGPRVQLATHLAAQPPVGEPLPIPSAQPIPEFIAPCRPSGQLTLAAAIEASLERNPDLVALRQSEGVSQAAAQVARAYPFNPTAQVEVLPFRREPGGGPSPTPLTAATVQQTFEMAHQRRYRASAGVADLDTTRWNIVRAEMLNMAQTERLFFTALYQRERHLLARSAAQLNEELLGVLERSFEAGQTPAADLALARLEARASRQLADRAEWNFQAALLNLRNQLGSEWATPLAPQGSLFDWQWRPAAGGLASGDPNALCPPSTGDNGAIDPAIVDLARGRPDVMAARTDLAAAGSRLELAEAMRVPNVKIGPFFEQTETATNLFGFQASRELAIVNTGLPLVRQRQAELQQKRETLRQLDIKARLEIRSAVDRYERARLLAQQSRAEAIDRWPREMRTLEDLFRAGQTDLVRVYNARSRLLQLRGTYLDILNDLAQAAADLTAATGLPAATLLAPTAEPLQ